MIRGVCPLDEAPYGIVGVVGPLFGVGFCLNCRLLQSDSARLGRFTAINRRYDEGVEGLVVRAMGLYMRVG